MWASPEAAGGLALLQVGFEALKDLRLLQGLLVPPLAGLEAPVDAAQMEPEDKLMFLTDLGLTESGLDRLIKAGYDLLGLISYLTAGKPEVRAWTIKKGTKAPRPSSLSSEHGRCRGATTGRSRRSLCSPRQRHGCCIPDGGQAGGPGLDHQEGHQGPPGGGEDTQRFWWTSPAANSASLILAT